MSAALPRRRTVQPEARRGRPTGLPATVALFHTQPALASANAEARPMPLPDPVTSATLPCSDGTTDEEQSVRRT